MSFLLHLYFFTYNVSCAPSDHDLPVLSCPAVQDVASQIDVVQSIHLREYPIFNICKAQNLSLDPWLHSFYRSGRLSLL